MADLASMAPRLFDTKPYHPEKDHFGHSKIPHSRAYDSPFLADWFSSPYLFGCSPLDTAAQSLLLFLKEDKWHWFSVIVSVTQLDHFYVWMDHQHNVLLPFWCYCDGGLTNVIHRHLIVVHPCEKDPGYTTNNAPLLNIQGISTPLTLLYYLNCLGRRTWNTIGCHGGDHFYLNVSLPRNAMCVLACVWENGLKQLMEHQLQHLRKETLQTVAYSDDKGGWKLSFRCFPNIPQYAFVFPVLKNLQVTDHVTPRVLYITHGKKLYFEEDRNLKNLELKVWVSLQASSGNVLRCFMKGAIWLPDEAYQKLLASKDHAKESKYTKPFKKPELTSNIESV